jgi:hypothetical protein
MFWLSRISELSTYTGGLLGPTLATAGRDADVADGTPPMRHAGSAPVSLTLGMAAFTCPPPRPAV